MTSPHPAPSPEGAARFMEERDSRPPMRPAFLAALLLAATLGPALFLPPPASASPYTWSPPELVDVRGVIDQVSLALDADGNPHIAYYDAFADDLRYAHWNGTAWVLEDVDTMGDVGSSPTILLDSAERPHILYVDVDPTNLLKRSVKNGTWKMEVVDSVGFVFRGSADAAWAPDGTLHACYYNNILSALRHARLSGGTWTNETVEAGPGGAGLYCSIAVASDGTPRIGYSNQGSGGDLRYAAWNGTSWNLTTVDAVDGVRDWTSLALNASGNPYISYLTGASEGKIIYHDGTAWRTLVAPSNAHFSPSITFDSQDRLHAPTWGFFGGIPAGFRHSVWDGAWANETFPQKFLDATSLALDAVGNPHLAWAVDGDLYYARAFSAPQAPTGPMSLQATAGNGQVSLSWTAPAWDGGSAVTGYRVYRGTAPGTLTALDTQGPSTAYTDAAVLNGVTYYYAVTAINAVGEGPPSNEATAIPSGPGDDPPTCAITSPSGGTVSGLVTIAGTATDPEGSLDRVEVRFGDGSWITANGTASWTHAWNSSAVVDGTTLIEARAHDGAQYSTPCEVTVTTDNGVAPPPDGDFLRDYGWILAFLVGVLLALGILVLARRRRRPAEPDQPGSP